MELVGGDGALCAIDYGDYMAIWANDLREECHSRTILC